AAALRGSRAVPPAVRARMAAHRGWGRAQIRAGEAVKKKTKDEPDREAALAGARADAARAAAERGGDGAPVVQAPPPEQVYADELAFLSAWDDGARPPSWRLTPRAVVVFIVGSQ